MGERIYFHVKKKTPMQAHSITAVASQPTHFRYAGMTSFPITFWLEAIVMMTAISGAATIPFRIAAQNSALTGSIWRKLSDSPVKVAIVMAA